MKGKHRGRFAKPNLVISPGDSPLLIFRHVIDFSSIESQPFRYGNNIFSPEAIDSTKDSTSWFEAVR
jgi:hypothetical protein